MAHHPEPVPNEEADQPRMQTLPMLMRIAWQRKWLILIGVIVGLVLGSLYYARLIPMYRSSTQVLVVNKRPNTGGTLGDDSRSSYYEDYLATHVPLIKSPKIVGKAVEKHQLQSLKCLAGRADPSSAIISALTVTRHIDKDGSPSSNILDLSFRGTVPEDCATILNALLDSYKDYLDENYRIMNDDTLTLITRARDELGRDLKKNRDALQQLRLQSQLLVRTDKGNSLQQEKLVTIEAKRSELLLRRTEIQGRLTAIEDLLHGRGGFAAYQGQIGAVLAFGSGGPLHVLPSLHLEPEDPVRGRAEFLTRPLRSDKQGLVGPTIEDQLFPLLLQEQTLLLDYGPDHPQVQAVRSRIRLTRKFYARGSAALGEALEPLPKGDQGREHDPVAWYVRSLKQELEDIAISEKALNDLSGRERKVAMGQFSDENQLETLRANIAETETLYKGVCKRLTEINLVRDTGGYTADAIAPPTPGVQVEPKPMPIFAMAGFMGLLCGMGLAYLAEVSDKSFRTPEEVRRRLGLPIVGHIPYISETEQNLAKATADNSGMDPMIATYHRFKSVEAEAYRGVRMALYFNTRGQGHQIIQVTSPEAGDGKTTMTANLAVAIAQSNKKILLIDADLRKPRVHKLFGLSSKVGLTSVMDGEVEVEKAVQESVVPGLSILTCGPRPHNPAELLLSPRFKEILESVRGQYDFVLVDSPPLLAVTDPSAISARVDGVLLVLRISKNGRPRAERAKEVLTTLGATIVGVVVNGVGTHADYRGYGYERYGYGYGRYSYGYHDDNSGGGYYTDRDGEEASPEQPETATLTESTNGSVDEPRASRVSTSGKSTRRKDSRSGLGRRIWKWILKWT